MYRMFAHDYEKVESDLFSDIILLAAKLHQPYSEIMRIPTIERQELVKSYIKVATQNGQ